MSVIIRASVALGPGARLRCDCSRADTFLKDHHGRYATFVNYLDELVGVLDRDGRLPGRYIDRGGLRVRFEGETGTVDVGARNFVVVASPHALVTACADEFERLSDLPDPILFYPGDTVRFKRGKLPAEHLLNVEREVDEVFIGNKLFAPDRIPHYFVRETKEEVEERARREMHEREGRSLYFFGNAFGNSYGWNTAGEDLELVSRGNVWALYNDPTKLRFASDEDQSKFWCMDGISRFIVGERYEHAGRMAIGMAYVMGQSLEATYGIFRSGNADVIQFHDFDLGGEHSDGYRARKLHDCFAGHREHVRGLTERLWAHKVKRSAA